MIYIYLISVLILTCLYNYGYKQGKYSFNVRTTLYCISLIPIFNTLLIITSILHLSNIINYEELSEEQNNYYMESFDNFGAEINKFLNIKE